MAETTANEAAQRYAVIEQAYSKENWATVLQEGEGLLLQLRQSDNPQLLGLQMRLQLLLGHTQLYGYGNKVAAAAYYGTVAEKSGEAALTKIATQGINQCAIEEPAAETAPTEAPTEAPEEAVTTVVAPTADVSGPAAPWLTAATAADTATAPTMDIETAPLEEAAASTAAAPWSEPSLIPEVVEEPELIELHQANPSLAEDVELAWKEPASATATSDKADEDLVSGLMLVRIG
ncbi:hypothetical protein [Synechococcus sp. CS-1332]|uniref:hypothetical protein n=1 Tax=Synechococcus sp. CS-1332 TaxID=2847972 RepID=UPI00223AA89E|nr:hypothetical protein [Synechococcus sp. CS-1332]MCT0209021.1 hypothetical protein [Synechococcus sp. CS-1332]